MRQPDLECIVCGAPDTPALTCNDCSMAGWDMKALMREALRRG